MSSFRPSRRQALRLASSGFGWLALRGLVSARSASDGVLAPRPPHFTPRARRVIFLCMPGAPSHVDTFDHKPELSRRDGETLSGYRQGARLLGSPWEFKKRGKSGLAISELLPEIGRHADRLCLLHGMTADVPAHAQAHLALHTGSSQFVRPSLGAWTLYGLGTEAEDLPGFVTLSPSSGNGGAQNYGSAFLPAATQGLRIGSERRAKRRRGDAEPEEVPDLANPRWSEEAQRAQLDLLAKLGRGGEEAPDDGVEDVIASYELAFRMQGRLPELIDLAREDARTLEAYGIGAPETDAFGRQCLIARKLVAAGVRFVEVGHGGWDHHRELRDELPRACRAIDRPIGALLDDLARSGLLADTLVLWGGEFGRTPYAQNGDGRDHNHRGFTHWMAGAGVKGGFAHGATDELGIEAVEGRLSIHDWHATVLHLLGLEHERLTFRHAGRDFRLTDVYGRVAREILA